MPWFKVDDSFHSHPKVLAASPAALGLWVVAGSWSGANLSDGFVPDHVLVRLLPDAATLAKQLASTGLWNRVRGGYRFHDWGNFNPASTAVVAEREAARKRMQAVRAKRKAETTDHRGDINQVLNEGRENLGRGARTGITPDQDANGSPEQQANVRAKFGDPDPTRPVIGGALRDPLTTARAQPQSPPSRRCPQHISVPSADPCGRCADARETRERWDLADADRRRTAAKCRHHRGQPADNCALCRSEALAAEESP